MYPLYPSLPPPTLFTVLLLNQISLYTHAVAKMKYFQLRRFHIVLWDFFTQTANDSWIFKSIGGYLLCKSLSSPQILMHNLCHKCKCKQQIFVFIFSYLYSVFLVLRFCIISLVSWFSTLVEQAGWYICFETEKQYIFVSLFLYFF